LGIDISEAMIELSRKRVPEAEFRLGSLFEAQIPRCRAVTAVSEVLNYLFDLEQELIPLFRRVYDSLTPGGLFVFDLAGPGQVRPGEPVRGFSEGEDWMVVLEKEEDAERGMYRRRITSFRKVGELYRRDDEVHDQRLYRPSEIAGELRQTGFRVKTMRSYGDYDLPRAHAAFLARKPR
jgi:SAM-dependent methyltransferase